MGRKPVVQGNTGDGSVIVRSVRGLREAENACRRCPLYRNATQAVPGEGPSHAAVMMVGEQPGEKEDLAGRPFVGPAGNLLDRALADAPRRRAACVGGHRPAPRGHARDLVHRRTPARRPVFRGLDGRAGVVRTAACPVLVCGMAPDRRREDRVPPTEGTRSSDCWICLADLPGSRA